MRALTLVFAPICYSVLRFTPAIEAEDICRPTQAPHTFPSCSQFHPAVLSTRRRILILLNNWAKQDIFGPFLSSTLRLDISRLYSVQIRHRADNLYAYITGQAVRSHASIRRPTALFALASSSA